jgi:hypothetical protein
MPEALSSISVTLAVALDNPADGPAPDFVGLALGQLVGFGDRGCDLLQGTPVVRRAIAAAQIVNRYGHSFSAPKIGPGNRLSSAGAKKYGRRGGCARGMPEGWGRAGRCIFLAVRIGCAHTRMSIGCVGSTTRPTTYGAATLYGAHQGALSTSTLTPLSPDRDARLRACRGFLPVGALGDAPSASSMHRTSMRWPFSHFGGAAVFAKTRYDIGKKERWVLARRAGPEEGRASSAPTNVLGPVTETHQPS